jgi:hypothetical protein
MADGWRRLDYGPPGIELFTERRSLSTDRPQMTIDIRTRAGRPNRIGEARR